MPDTLSLTVGDLVVRHGKVLKVFQVKKDSVDLKPFFNFQSTNGLTFTLKTKNAYDGQIRELVSKGKIKALVDLIIKKSASKIKPPVFDSKTALNQNKLKETLWVIKTLWLEKQEKSDVLPGGKLTIFRQAMLQATEEIAAANRISPEKATSLILSALKSNRKTKRKN